jgi:anti-sigma-K factor RskA
MSRRRIRPAEVALGLVDPADEAEVQRLLAEDPEFRAEVDRLAATAELLGRLDGPAWRPPAPPALTERAADPPQRRRPAWRVLVPAAGLAAALAAVVIAVSGRTPTRTIALHAVGHVPGTATLALRGGEAELHGSGMPPSGPHDHYRPWLEDAHGRMVSMGSFRVAADGRVDAHMPITVDLSRYILVDVSIEPDGGPPGRPVMRARL